MKRLSLFCAAAVAAILPPAFAANTEEPVVVTATRTARTADETLASVTVITRAEIERSQANTVPELLQGLPGVDLAVSGGYGQQTSLFLRGTNSGHTLLLVDGIRLGSATAGTLSWEFLPVSEIDRIEIVRGPRSSLYGSEAIGGVIQIFTRRGTGPARGQFALRGGSHNTREVSGGISGATESSWYHVHAGQLVIGGINARTPVVEFGSPVDDPDHDGYRNKSASTRIGHRFGNGAEIEFHGLHAQGDVEFDNSSTGTNKTDFTQQALGTRLMLRPLATWQSSFALGRSLDERFSYRATGGVNPTRFDTKRRTFTWLNDLTLARNQLVTLGYDYYDDQVFSTTTYDKLSRNNKAVFGQYQMKFNRHDAIVSLRDDDNEQFGRHGTGNLAWGYALTDRTRVMASYGQGFKAPTFNDLYYPGSSNPNLKPERSHTTEVGIKTKRGNAAWAVNAYHTTIGNLIALDSSFIPQNVSQARIRGLETEASLTAGPWRLAGSLAFLNPRDTATDRVLTRRSRRSAKLDADYRFGKVDIGASLVAQGPRYDNAANTTEMGGYGIVHLRARYPLARGWSISGRIENVFDKDYQTVYSYNSPGRGFFLTLAYQPDA